MDIKEIAKQALETAFIQFESIVQPVMFTQTVIDSVDLITEESISTNTSITVDSIFYDGKSEDGSFTGTQIAGDAVEIGDETIIVKASDITMTLSKKVQITRVEDNSNWSLISFKLDPAGVMYQIQARKAS